MRSHTQRFKEEIGRLGRQIKIELMVLANPGIRTESEQTIITEDGNKLITEWIITPVGEARSGSLIPEENIYSVSIIKNGALLKTLMQQCDIEIKNEFNIGTVFTVRLGVLVDGTYKYLNYGDCIVYSKEYNVENNTWKYICYDRMLWAMKKYVRLNVTYPITVREYIKAITNRIGIDIFYNQNQEFTNYNQLIYKDHFAGKDITYRDILDKLAEVTASNITAGIGQELYIKYPTETNDIIDENYLKNINVNFGKQFGPVNRIEATDKQNNLYYSIKDNTSIQQNGETRINIIDNPFIFNGQENEICQNILNKLKSLKYSINDFTTTGVCYYDYLDLFTVSANNQNYKCLLLNNEIKIQQGIEETIFSTELENAETEINNFQNNSMSNKEIQQKVEKMDDDKVSKNNIVNSLNQSPEANVIRTNKIFIIKNLTGTTDSNGFLDVGINNDYVICSAIGEFSSNDYGFLIPYYYYNNGHPLWKLKIENQNGVALANTQINVTIYFVRKEG